MLQKDIFSPQSVLDMNSLSSIVAIFCGYFSTNFCADFFTAASLTTVFISTAEKCLTGSNVMGWFKSLQ